MIIYAIVKSGCLLKFVETEEQKKSELEVCGREAITCICKTKREQKLLKALFNLTSSIVKTRDGYEINPLTRLDMTDEEVYEDAQQALTEFVGIGDLVA
jgi:hypothetical protein